jgi:RNA polymerase sigma-70 factor (ECF subfamily)
VGFRDETHARPAGDCRVIDWEGILREHGPAVWRTAFRLTANRADADECFQETFADAVALVRREASGEPVRQWHAMLVRLVTARAVDLADHEHHTRPAARAEQAELSAALRVALAHLPPKQADAFCLHALEGWSYREVAQHLETSVDDVGVCLHRARAALRERLGSILPVANAATAAADNESRRRLRERPGPNGPRPDEVSHES